MIQKRAAGFFSSANGCGWHIKEMSHCAMPPAAWQVFKVASHLLTVMYWPSSVLASKGLSGLQQALDLSQHLVKCPHSAQSSFWMQYFRPEELMTHQGEQKAPAPRALPAFLPVLCHLTQTHFWSPWRDWDFIQCQYKPHSPMHVDSELSPTVPR